MNNLQKIACGISGYEPYESFSSARDDGYYNCKTEEEKIAYVFSYADHVDGVKGITTNQAEDIVAFLEANCSGTGEWFDIFQEL